MTSAFAARLDDIIRGKEAQRGAVRWHFSRIQLLVVALGILSLGYMTLELTWQDHYRVNSSSGRVLSDAESFYQHLTNKDQESTVNLEHTSAASSKVGIEVDSKDINPTMPLGIKKALVIASYEGQQLDWLDDLVEVSSGWEVFRYTAKNEGSDDIGIGREATAFLQFIVDNYDDFPDVAIFNHGHDRSWHQPMRLMDKVITLNHTALAEEHYINLRCTEAPGCTNDTKYYFDNPKEGDKRWGYRLKPFWNDRMRPSLGPMPRVIGRKCCAQFALDRVGVHHRPLIFYERLLEPLVTKNITELHKIWDNSLPRDRIATMYEMVWNQIFGKPADFCPSTDICNKVHFQDKIHCDREVEAFKTSQGWEKIKCTNDLMVKNG